MLNKPINTVCTRLVGVCAHLKQGALIPGFAGKIFLTFLFHLGANLPQNFFSQENNQ